MADINDTSQGPPASMKAAPEEIALVKVSATEAVARSYGSRPLMVPQEPVQRGLLEYRHVLWRKKGLLLLCMLLGLAVGTVVTIYEQPTYIARTTLEFQPRISQSPVQPEMREEGSYDESAIATYEHVLQSRSLRQKVVQKLKTQPLAQKAVPVANSSLLLEGLEKLGLPVGVSPQRSTYKGAVAQAASTLKAKTIPQTRIVEITCESASPTVAAEFANGVVNEFMEEDLQSHWNSTQSTNKLLTEELQQLKAKLGESERTLNDYAQKTGITFASPNSTLVDDQLKRTQQDLAAASNERVAKEAKYKIALATSSDMFTDAVGDPALQGYRSQLADLHRQYAELSSTFTPAYFKVKRIQAQIAEVEEAAAKERKVSLERIKEDYDEAARRQDMFGAEYRKQVASATVEAQRVLQYGTLKNDFDANRQLYESVMQRVRELDITSAMHASNIRIIDAAEAPGAPDRPNPARNLGFGMFSGLVFGVGFFFWKDQVSSSVWGPGEGPLILNLPELGVIPSSKLDKPGRSYGRLRSGHPENAVLLTHGRKGRGAGAELAAWQQPSLVAESFRRTVASILFSTDSRLHPRVIVVTSPGQGDGKSTVSSNLAIALAEIRLRVLLIDADLRNPRLHKIFDVANTWGLTNLLEETTPIATLPQQALCRETKVSNLQLLTSGPPATSVSQLIFSERLAELIARCKKDFDVILIDTPPLLQVSDARAIARHSEGVVLVLRAGCSKLKAAIASTEVLVQDGSPILGTVLNDWDPRTGGSDHLYDAYYASHYRGSAS